MWFCDCKSSQQFSFLSNGQISRLIINPSLLSSAPHQSAFCKDLFQHCYSKCNYIFVSSSAKFNLCTYFRHYLLRLITSRPKTLIAYGKIVIFVFAFCKKHHKYKKSTLYTLTKNIFEIYHGKASYYRKRCEDGREKCLQCLNWCTCCKILYTDDSVQHRLCFFEALWKRNNL